MADDENELDYAALHARLAAPSRKKNVILDWLFDRTIAPPSVSVTEAAKMLRHRHVLLDVRQIFEFDSAHAPGATLLPLTELGTRARELDKNTPLLVICRSGHRSAIATRMLAHLGLDVTNVDGGMTAWRKAGLPTERGKVGLPPQGADL